jgi:proline iminopeptidase
MSVLTSGLFLEALGELRLVMEQLTLRGSTLALAYSQTHPDKVKALALRGIFLFRRKEIDFFWRTGTRCESESRVELIDRVLPRRVVSSTVAWIHIECELMSREEFVAPIKPEDREDFDTFNRAYHALLTHPDDNVSLDAAKRWSRWESQVARLIPKDDAIARSDTDVRWARLVSYGVPGIGLAADTQNLCTDGVSLLSQCCTFYR